MAILDIVKLDVQSDDYIVQKFYSEKQWELALGSRLVVNEGQEALFVKGGKALDLFTAGT
ncbi:MAG: SPFH domain-containing protein, partial [Lentisphaeria bacterium]|nr:SPFH domain-containing protein [Lentisphaeria bacterium]